METPRYTVIIPMARYSADEPALVSLRTTPPPDGGVQIIVAVGAHPALQRNAALARARGEVVVFLDNDCSLGEGYWDELLFATGKLSVFIVGGPARLRPGAGAWEQIYHTLLTHLLVVGTVSARYDPRGKFRPATQTDLILCNLAVRRTAFVEIGPLSSDLYPNEENEWLDRAHAAKLGAYYDPALQVFRPQRATFGRMMLTLLRYGMGRTRQFRVSGWRVTFHQVLPLMMIAAFAALVYWRLELEFLLLWLVASLTIAATCPNQLKLWQCLAAGLVAPLVPLVYALGQLLGWPALCFNDGRTSSEIILLDETGHPL